MTLDYATNALRLKRPVDSGERPLDARSASPAGFPRWCLMAAMLNGGGALDWARRALQLGWDDARRARALAAYRETVLLSRAWQSEL